MPRVLPLGREGMRLCSLCPPPPTLQGVRQGPRGLLLLRGCPAAAACRMPTERRFLGVFPYRRMCQDNRDEEGNSFLMEEEEEEEDPSTPPMCQDNRDEEGNSFLMERISIDAGFIVCSVAFGTGTPEKDLVPVTRGYWTRFDFSKDLILATGHANGRIRIWDPYTGKLLLELTDHTQAIHSLAFALDGSLRLVSGSKDAAIKVWDLTDDGNMYKTLRDHRAPVRCVAWSHDSRYLCSVGNGQKVIMWDMRDYKLVRRYSGHFNTVYACAFSPDDAMLVTASSDTRAIIWDTHTGAQLKVLYHVLPPPGVIYMSGSNNSIVRGVTFSPNGCYVSTICGDGLLRFWNLHSTSEEPESVGTTLPGDTMLSCRFSPLGGAVAVCHQSGSILFFHSPCIVPSLLHLARMSVRRALGNVDNCDDILVPKMLKTYLQYKCW